MSKTPRADGGQKSARNSTKQKQQDTEQDENPRKETGTKTENARQESSAPEKKTGGAGSSSPRGKQKKEKQQEQEQHRSPNKIYRTPPTPEPEILHVKERSFILDSIAVNNISQNYSRAKPKLGQIIPPYNSQLDRSTQPYFGFNGVRKTLKRNGQEYPGTAIEGQVIDRAYKYGPGSQYVSLRNLPGAGHSRETIDGHGLSMLSLSTVRGYNGDFGYRRNTPWLRREPSSFGLIQDARSPPHTTSARA